MQVYHGSSMEISEFDLKFRIKKRLKIVFMIERNLYIRLKS